jgi:hypothetical protein
VYASVWTGPESYGVFSWKWKGSALIAQGPLREVPSASTDRPVTVLSGDAYAGRSAYLVIGAVGRDTLLVISLPHGKLLHQRSLHGVSLRSLASAPDGSFLVVLDDNSRAAIVLPTLALL